MAESNAFKQLEEKDMVSTRTLLHEAIPLTGTIISGSAYSDTNIKNPPHGMFQSVYDYSYLSSSANHIFDITVGVSGVGLTATEQIKKKKNVYNQMSQVLVGYDADGAIQHFDQDGDLTGGDKYEDVFIIPFSRLLVKDEIKKGTFSMTLGIDSAYATPFNDTLEVTDASGSDQYYVNSPVGEYGILYASGSTMVTRPKAGLLYYQAGIAVIRKDVFLHSYNTEGADAQMSGTANIDTVLQDNTIEDIADALRHRTQNIQFNNTTELNSTIYFCRANHNEFNYSTNPTYVDGSKIRVKVNSTDEPVAYITSIGLYSDNGELMATAKLSEPLKKTPSTEFTLRCRLDY